MQLFTSNFYTQQENINHEEYIQSIINKDYNSIFCSYKDFYLLSNIKNNLFPNFVELTIDIPESLLFESNFVPFYVLQNYSDQNKDYPFDYFYQPSDKISGLKKKRSDSNKLSDTIKEAKIFFIKKADFKDEFVIDYQHKTI